MTSGWPPDEPDRRRSQAPPGGSHRRSAVRTPPHGTDFRGAQFGEPSDEYEAPGRGVPGPGGRGTIGARHAGPGSGAGYSGPGGGRAPAGNGSGYAEPGAQRPVNGARYAGPDSSAGGNWPGYLGLGGGRPGGGRSGGGAAAGNGPRHAGPVSNGAAVGNQPGHVGPGDSRSGAGSWYAGLEGNSGGGVPVVGRSGDVPPAGRASRRAAPAGNGPSPGFGEASGRVPFDADHTGTSTSRDNGDPSWSTAKRSGGAPLDPGRSGASAARDYGDPGHSTAKRSGPRHGGQTRGSSTSGAPFDAAGGRARGSATSGAPFDGVAGGRARGASDSSPTRRGSPTHGASPSADSGYGSSERGAGQRGGGPRHGGHARGTSQSTGAGYGSAVAGTTSTGATGIGPAGTASPGYGPPTAMGRRAAIGNPAAVGNPATTGRPAAPDLPRRGGTPHGDPGPGASSFAPSISGPSMYGAPVADALLQDPPDSTTSRSAPGTTGHVRKPPGYGAAIGARPGVDERRPPAPRHGSSRPGEPGRTEPARSRRASHHTRPSPPDAVPERPADSGDAFRLHVPRQAGQVSSPSRPRDPGRADELAPFGRRDETQVLTRTREAGPPPQFAAAGATPGAAGTRSRRRGTRTTDADEPRPSSRSQARAGRRRSLRGKWLWIGGAVAAAAGAAIAAVTMLGGGPVGPAHTLVIPARLGVFAQSPQLARQMDVNQLEKNILSQASGQVSHLVSAVYQEGAAAVSGPAPQVMLFIGGKLTGASPTDSVKTFASHFNGATLTNAGRLGGEAACVPAQTSTGGSAVCAWFDNDTFGELVSPNLTAGALADELRAIRPSIELLAK
jgi:hypothetical protein